jgi:hypothetical protein
MAGIGLTELIVIAVIALVVIALPIAAVVAIVLAVRGNKDRSGMP